MTSRRRQLVGGSVSNNCPTCGTGMEAVAVAPAPPSDVTCGNCKTVFGVEAATVRAKRARGNRNSNSRTFSVRVVRVDGSETLIEFRNASYQDFELRSGDILLATYRDGKLVQVANLTVRQYMNISDPRCFVASAVFGAASDEVVRLRVARDQYILPFPGGPRAVSLYYRAGPHLTMLVRRSPVARAFVRIATRAILTLPIAQPSDRY